MTKQEIADALEAAHEALKLMGQLVAGGNPQGGYQLNDANGNAIPSFDKLANEVRAL